MTAVERAEQAVTEASADLLPYLCRSLTVEGANRMVADLVRAVEARCAERQAAEREAARERARETARRMFAGLMPGQTGKRMADEIADKILAAVYNTQEQP
jgi:hypothetical protein